MSSASTRTMAPAAVAAALELPVPSPSADRVLALLQATPAGGPIGDEGLQQQRARLALDDFERSDWPAGTPLDARLAWIPSSLTDLIGGPFGYHWALSDCQVGGGSSSLCAVCGGTGGDQLACGDAYPDRVASSVLLRLDLAAWREMDQLDLVMDVWADAEPHEGMILNYLDYAPDGSLIARHPVLSTTGTLRDWARDQRLDLLELRDELDPTWSRSLAGQIALFELLFVSSEDGGNGEGIFVDNLAIELQPRTVVVTPEPSPTATASPSPIASPSPVPSATPIASPTPSNATVYCPPGSDCSRLRVEAFVDLRCDGRYQAGLDRWVDGQRVDVDVAGIQLGTTLSRNGSAYFLLPTSSGITVRFEVPAGFRMCGNSPNPRILGPADFGRFGNKQIDFRIVRQR